MRNAIIPESKIHKEKKQNLADKIILGDGGSLAALTKEELQGLFQDN